MSKLTRAVAVPKKKKKIEQGSLDNTVSKPLSTIGWGTSTSNAIPEVLCTRDDSTSVVYNVGGTSGDGVAIPRSLYCRFEDVPVGQILRPCQRWQNSAIVDMKRLRRDKGVLFYNNLKATKNNTSEAVVAPAAQDNRGEVVKTKQPENHGGQEWRRQRKKNLNWTDDQMQTALAQHEH